MGAGITSTGRGYEYSKQPGDLEGIRGYYLERGYKEDPIGMPEGEVASFAKPIPGKTGQARHHVRIERTQKYYTIDSHVDNYDPEQNALGHLVDIVGSLDHSIKKVRRTDNA